MKPFLAILMSILSTIGFAKSPLAPETVRTNGTVRLGGLVTSVGDNHNFILARDDERIMIFVSESQHVKPGDIVEIICHEILNDDGEIHTTCERTVVRGHADVPPPAAVPLGDIDDRLHDLRAITVEATLVSVKNDEIDNSYDLLVLKDGDTYVNASQEKADDALQDRIGSRVRITGVWHAHPNGARKFHRYLDIEGEISTIPSDAADPRQRFDGLVMAVWDRDKFLLVNDRYQLMLAQLADSRPPPRPGDTVAVTGYPDHDAINRRLIYADWRPIPSAGIREPAPVDSSLRDILTDRDGRAVINGYANGHVLRLEGMVIESSSRQLILEDGGVSQPITLETPREVEAGSRLRLTAVAVVEADGSSQVAVQPRIRGITLINRAGDEFEILARPPWLTVGKLIAFIILLTAVFLARERLSRGISRMKIRERTRLAVELHDSLSQTLSGLACQIAAAEADLRNDPEKVKQRLGTAGRILESCRKELRNCLFDLRNSTIDCADFQSAVAKTLAEFTDAADISIRFRVARGDLPDATVHAVLSIIRELTVNAIRHGGAATIQIAGTKEKGLLMFSVGNDGATFDPASCPGPQEGHFGLAGIRERVASLHGSFTIGPRPGCGMRTRISLPIARNDNG